MSTAVRSPSELPGGLTVAGNFPNPFSSKTTIRYDLPTHARVHLDVLNMVGKKVMSLPDRDVDAGFGRSVDVDAGALASGVYMYHLVAVESTGTVRSSGEFVVLH